MHFSQRAITTFFIFTSILFSSEYSQQAVIIVDKNADHIKIFAARELKKHLQLILNKNVLITNSQNDQNRYKYLFYIGNNSQGISKTLKPEEARYEIIKNKIYLYGDDLIQKKETLPIETITYMRNKTGTLFSVYDFLYTELNIRWIEPGDIGISYTNISELIFEDKVYSWYPTISFRYFRNDIWRWSKLTSSKYNLFKYTPKELQPSKEYAHSKEIEELIWMRRMKQGINNKPGYGHAFTRYWNKYGKQNPKWFALGKNGQRGLKGSKSKKEKRVKLCVSNQELQNQIIKNWKNNFIKYKTHNIYNSCINDSRSYCRCAKCRALDNDYKKYPSENFETESKTDRYVYFWNSLIQKAKVFNPNAQLIAYAYSDYRYPPKTQNLSNDIILGFVPRFSDLPNNTKLDLQQWQKKGLKQVFLRPNDFNDDIGMPMGHEKFIYTKLKIFKDINMIGVDYDRSYNFNNWCYDGITYYIIAQAINNKNKTFEELEDEYYATFENSQKEMKSFYTYWHKNFETKRLTDIKNSGGFGGRKNIYKNINQFYSLQDFNTTDMILNNAFKKANTKSIKKRIERLIIMNKHSRLLYIAIKNNDKLDYENLINFRIKNKKELSLSWAIVFYTEEQLTNINGSNIYIKRISNKIKSYF